VTQNGDFAIGFSMNTPAMTRSTGEVAATALGNEFIVWGEKVMSGDETKEKASDGNLVFKNYRVQYSSGTANTTVSNTKDWEYVGLTPYVESTVKPALTTTQTIKYWDTKAAKYTFTAVSAKQTDLKPTDGTSSPLVTIEKIESDNNSAYNKGYKIAVKAGASAGNIYVADRYVVTPPTTSTAVEPVTMKFRNFQSKIRFGIYETVPGYKVVITGVTYNNPTATGETVHPTTPKSGSTEPADKTFGISGKFVVPGANTTYTVTYRNDTGHDGEAKVEVTGTANEENSINTKGTNWLSTSFSLNDQTNCIGEAANSPTYDLTTGSGSEQVVGDYTAIMPNPDNKTNLTLKISYDLYSEDTGEKISVDYKTVEVPAAYCQWKSNYAYTYLFKITDKSAELYPITFDACVVESETGNQETITEVGEPSITTFAVKDNKIVTDKDEYEDGNTIYATIVEGSSLVTMTESNIKLYTVTATGTQIISEASVANCLANGTKNDATSPTTWTSTAGSGNVLTVTAQSYSADNDLLNAVPSEDGKTVTLDKSAKKAIKWAATGSETAAIYYVVEYIKTDNSTTTKYYKIVKIAKKVSTGS
jgi:hypothetical protein